MASDMVIELESLPLTKAELSYPLSAKQLYASLPLELDTYTVRLLAIAVDPSLASESVPSTRHITGSLRTVDLQRCPSFVCLSYVWGQEASSSHVVKFPSHGCSIEITENCFQALWHIQKRFGLKKTVTIWVDSICINQDDEREKENQIPLMQQIYSLADSVYIWLGLGNVNSNRAMEYLRWRASRGRRLPLKFLVSKDPRKKQREYRSYRKRAWSDVLSRCKWPPFITGSTALDEIFNGEWIHRSWTFQEFILATDPVILFGNEAISWENLVSALFNTEEWRQLWWLARSDLFQKMHIKLWEEGELPLGLEVVYCIGNAIFIVTILGVWGFTSYKIMLAAKGLGLSFPPWFLLVLGWLIAFVNVCKIALALQKIWHDLVRGWKQEWLLRDRMDSENFGVIDAIRGALRERKSKHPLDKSYALNGILRAYGLSPSAPDYSDSVGKTYQDLLQTLLLWNPAAIAVVMDAGSKVQFDGPTWVPNWQYSPPSSWLTSKHLLGVTGTCTLLPESPLLKISGSRLRLPGIYKGTVTFQIDVHPMDCDCMDGCLTATLHSVLLWMAYIQNNAPPTKPNDIPLSFLFAILEGLGPKRGPTGKLISNPGAGSIPGHTSWKEYPLFKGPYDFTLRKEMFDRWNSLYEVLKKHIPREGTTDALSDIRPISTNLLDEIKTNRQAYQYLLSLQHRISKDGRGLFVLSSGLVGTGPREIVIGDEVFLLAGIPVPMTLRRKAGAENMTVVGAALVHGIMHRESYNEERIREVVLI